jgi:hypothetical protein
MDRRHDGVRRRGEKAIDGVRARDWLGLGALDSVPRSPLNSVHIPANVASGRSSLNANQTTSFFSGFGSGAYSAKLLNGTRQRLSGLSPIRQCGEDVLRMFVTGGPPVLSPDALRKQAL